MMQPNVWVILVNYKAVVHTIECIESLQNLEYENMNIVVVDNCSEDDSVLQLRQKYPTVYILENATNAGFAGGNRTGIDYALAHGAEYILMLNNDTVVKPNFLTELMSHAVKEMDMTAIVTAKILYYDTPNLICYAGGHLSDYKGDAVIRGYMEEDRGQYDQIEYQSFASGCCMLIPRRIFENNYYMTDDYFLYYEDVDYCKKLAKDGYRILYVPNVVVYHKESVSTDQKSDNFSYYFARNRLWYIQKNIKGYKKFIAYLYSYLWLSKKVVTGQFVKKAVWKGIKEFINGVK